MARRLCIACRQYSNSTFGGRCWPCRVTRNAAPLKPPVDPVVPVAATIPSKPTKAKLDDDWTDEELDKMIAEQMATMPGRNDDE